MKRISVVSLVLCIVGGSAALAAGEPAEAIHEQSEALKAAFLRAYTPVELDVKPNAPQLTLPFDLGAVGNATLVGEQLPSKEAQAMLARNGFVVVSDPGTDLFDVAYTQLKDRDVPIVVTSDSVLHLYHVMFDNTLMQVEESVFYGDLETICRGLAIKCHDRVRLSGRPVNPIESEAEQMNVAYFSVASKLLDPDWQPPEYVAGAVDKELALIDAHVGFAVSPLFGYKEDYSQYVPRGHYTQSEKLKRYFKAMMWLGRMTFLLKGNNDAIHDALVDEHTANRQTLAALMIARNLTADPALYGKWERLYTVTAFFVGFSDDLTVDDYVMQDRIAGAVSSTQYLDAVRLRLARKRTPLIYGGTGLAPVAEYTDEEIVKNLAATQGMRFMGQRFVPDSYVMGRLVNLPYTGDGNAGQSSRASSQQHEVLPFTYTMSQIGPIRGFPRGLDVMHILGSARALAILEAEGDTAYADYATHVTELRTLFDGFDPADWHQNLYWGWLASLRTLLAPSGEGYPSFMQTEAYTDKALHTALASWSQLRHDTILYAKQSYAMVGSAMPPPEPEVKGYVEPLPALYAELIALNAMTQQGLTDLGVMPDEMQWRFRSTDRLLRRLLAISIKELEGTALDKDDLDLIKNFGTALDGAIGDLKTETKRTTIVADVHTDPNSGLVLEEGTGPIDLMWVVWQTPGRPGSASGEAIAGAGPVFSHYEFKQPMRDRLTDEKWRERLRESAPGRAPWTKRFLAEQD
ncbi:MAG: DUF3160 domain-containing protein [Verrucomicrobia bacterium]|nr:DUF3160 domain-containing protein [Verrucomicrobiota bacterium]